jgi:hypothetical protein
MLAAMQVQNLLYVVGALLVASVVSGLYVLRHRKPKSLEAGIESFSRELRALAPERRQAEESGVRTLPIVRNDVARGTEPERAASIQPAEPHGDDDVERPARGESG